MLTLFFVNGDAIPLCFTCASYHMTIPPSAIYLFTAFNCYVLIFSSYLVPASTIYVVEVNLEYSALWARSLVYSQTRTHLPTQSMQ